MGGQGQLNQTDAVSLFTLTVTGSGGPCDSGGGNLPPVGGASANPISGVLSGFFDFVTNVVIAPGVTIGHGYLVGVNSSNQAVVADRAAGVYAEGAACFAEDHSAPPLYTGDGSQRVSIYRKVELVVPVDLTPGGRLFLSSVGGFEQTESTTTGDLIQGVGYAKSKRVAEIDCSSPAILKYQTAATSNAKIA